MLQDLYLINRRKDADDLDCTMYFWCLGEYGMKLLVTWFELA